jgi:sulfite reductase (NADPH) hemoprotein beta-component
MYRYDAYDQALADARVARFREQTRRYLAGELSEDEFRSLHLLGMNEPAFGLFFLWRGL